MKKCLECGHEFRRAKAKGHILIELACWGIFCFPGIIYTLWRMTARGTCPKCGSERWTN
jgi:hypothetical protein